MKELCEKIIIQTDGEKVVEAKAPLIISASRATDIPAFYLPWFFDRLEKGYIRWRNPFNGRDSYISLSRVRFIVFWSKNPRPLLAYLPRLSEKGIKCYVQYTLNDYESEGLEPNVPPLDERVDTFKKLVNQLGRGSVVWRFDPLILTDKIAEVELLKRIESIAHKLKGYAEKLVISFADIANYSKVCRNLSSAGVLYREWSESDMRSFANELSKMKLGMKISTCAEKIPLEEFGIEHNRCVDPDLICKLQPELQPILWNVKRDKGQRAACGCAISKDIGAYNTCPHSCLYCYANSSASTALKNHTALKSQPFNDSLSFTQ